ncbi:hypothetical protein [Patulibacter minatonensis]|uniref:hypothetical protein n=1 Tax=Patulibacter minatonensis TaxID=298163 RepID=UPI00047D9D0C|nr:hypothetical protein [Patulibacter minatonensis]
MQGYHATPQDRIPEAGFRARRWGRFERDLHAWMESPEGRFAAWRAHASVTGEHATGTTRRD